MAEEGISNGNPASVETLQRRLDRLEQEYMRENRWWRGGLIGALVLLAIVILIGGFHHRPPPPRGFGPMAMQGPIGMQGPMGMGGLMAMQGPMGYPGYGYPPPPWAYGYSGYGPGPGYGCERHGWCRRAIGVLIAVLAAVPTTERAPERVVHRHRRQMVRT